MGNIFSLKTKLRVFHQHSFWVLHGHIKERKRQESGEKKEGGRERSKERKIKERRKEGERENYEGGRQKGNLYCACITHQLDRWHPPTPSPTILFCTGTTDSQAHPLSPEKHWRQPSRSLTAHVGSFSPSLSTYLSFISHRDLNKGKNG